MLTSGIEQRRMKTYVQFGEVNGTLAPTEQNETKKYRARICKRLRRPGIDSARLCSLGSLKGLQIRALYVHGTLQSPNL